MLNASNLIFAKQDQDPTQLFLKLTGSGEILNVWPHKEHGARRICVRAGDYYWIWVEGFGGIKFQRDKKDITIYRHVGVGENIIMREIIAHWLPYVYQLWGFQVIHGSAVYNNEGQVIIFAGPTGSGKSTLGFAFGKTGEWEQLVDDSIAFTVSGNEIQVVEIPSLIRLRQPSAEYFQEPAYSHQQIHWPDKKLSIGKIYFLEDQPDHQIPEILPIAKPLAYRQLLVQAYVLSELLTDLNRRLMQDYLDLTSRVPLVRLRFGKDFRLLNELIDLILEDFHGR